VTRSRPKHVMPAERPRPADPVGLSILTTAVVSYLRARGPDAAEPQVEVVRDEEDLYVRCRCASRPGAPTTPDGPLATWLRRHPRATVDIGEDGGDLVCVVHHPLE
jgi:hypothetical protein